MSKVEKEAIAKAPSGRPVRQTTGTRNKFEYINKDPAYEYRVAVDTDGTGDRIAELKDIGYEFAPANVHRLGSSRVDKDSNEGTLETQNSGAGTKGYLMRIKKEWYEEDKKAKAARVEATEQGLKTPSLDGTYGKIDINSK
jgi:hypothetical protein